MTIAIIVVVAIIVIAVLYFIAKRNSIIAARNRVDESWSGIDVQLKRRHDLVPNLVETVKGYAAHESETFEKTTQARAEAMSAAERRRHRPGRAETDQRAGRPARRRRELPDAARHRELPAAQPQPLRARGRNPGLAADLQLQRAVLQHRHPAVPGLDHRQPGQLHGARVLRDRGRRRARAGLGQLRQIERPLSFRHERDHRSDPLDLRELRVHLRPRDRRPRRRHPARNPLRGHPQGLVLPRLRRPHLRLPPARAGRGLGRRGQPGRVTLRLRLDRRRAPASGARSRPCGWPKRATASRVLECGKRFDGRRLPQVDLGQPRATSGRRGSACGAIFRLSFFKDVAVVCGCGVGGGSLGYANTLYRARPRLLRRPAVGRPGELGGARSRPTTTPRSGCSASSTTRATARPTSCCASSARRSASATPTARPPSASSSASPARRSPTPTSAARGPARTGCMHCGRCMVGCRHGAKNTLVKNYLWFAEQLGVEDPARTPR